MSSSCVESQGCHLFCFSNLLSRFCCLVLLIFLSCHFSANGPFSRRKINKLKTFFYSVLLLLRRTSVSIHIITLYISMIRAEENYSRLTVVEEIIWKRERERERERERFVRTHTHIRPHTCTHAHARTHTHTHTLDRKEW